MFDRASGPYAEAERQFDEIWRRAKAVGDADLVQAQETWSRRRRIGFARQTSKAPDLLSAISSSPDQFTGRRIYLTVDSLQRSPASEAKLKAERERQHGGEELDCWEDWDAMPNDATFVAFWRGPRGGVRFEGYFYSPPQRREVVNEEGVTLQLIDKLNDIDGIKRVGDLARWVQIIHRAHEHRIGDKNGTFEVELGRLCADFLSV